MKWVRKRTKLLVPRCLLWLVAFPCFIISSITLSYSQFLDLNEKSRWVHFTTYSGLPAGEIISLFESSDSTLWVSTLTGLAWYDGFRWRRGDDTSYWPAGKAITIRGEYHDSILINTTGANYLGGKKGFRNISKRLQENLSLMKGDSLPLNQNAALFLLYTDSIKQKPDESFISRITALYRTKIGSTWVTLDDGLYGWDGSEWKIKLLPTERQPGLSVAMVTENNRGSGVCFVRTPAGKMGVWEWKRNGPLLRSKLEKRLLYMVSADIDEDDNVVAVAQTGDIIQRHNDQWKISSFFPENAKNITKVMFRKNGDLCVGSEDGVFIWRRSFNRWITLPRSPIELKNCIDEILITRSGNLWIGSANGLEIRYANGRMEDMTYIGNQRILNITGLQEDGDGNVWISSGSSFAGTYKWDGKSWTYYPITGYSNGIYFHKIRKDNGGRLWFLGLGHNIATADDDASGAYILENGKFTRWGIKEGLRSGRVYAFAEQQDGSMWFGTHKGISRLKSGNWTHWSTVNGLHWDHVFCLANDHDGGIWFGHMSTTGLGYIDRQDSVHYFTTDDGITDNRIYDIKVDSGGVVWIASHGGLCCYDHGQWSTFDENSGLVSNALWPVVPLDHSVYVGTLAKGVAILNRDAAKAYYPNIVIEKPIVEDQDAFISWDSFAYYGEVAPANSITRYRINHGGWSPWNTIHDASFRKLPPGSYTIGVQAKGLYGQFNPNPEIAVFAILPPLYLRPVIYFPASGAIIAMISLLVILQLRRIKHRRDLEKSEERYRLVTELMSDYAYLIRIEEDGKFDILWITESFTRLTGYSIDEFKSPEFMKRFNHSEDLPNIVRMFESVMMGKPESYEGRVRIKNGNLLWIHNHVAPIWDRDHRHVTHMYGIARDVTRRKHDEEQMRMLATELSLTEERERRRMATFLHDTIGQTMAFSKMKLRTLERTVLDEKMLESLREIRKLVEESINNTRSLTFELSPPALHELGVAEALRSLAEQLFGEHNIKLEYVEEQLSCQLPNDLSVVLYYAVREVLINTIKHSQATVVSISVCFPDGAIRVKVRDNGIGIMDLSEGIVHDRKNSFGLFNIRERITHLGGTVEISSIPNEGTTVILTVPINPTLAIKKESKEK